MKMQWYDEEGVMASDISRIVRNVEVPDFGNPKDIYQYLDDHVYGHKTCKKKLSMFLWHMLYAQMNGNRKGGRSLLILGNSGTGKTEFFRALSRVYPNIFIANAAAMTPQGFKGEVKLYSGLKNLDCSAKNMPPILVIDEWDKVVSDENWNDRGKALQSEALKMMEGTKLNIGTDEKPQYVDTSNVNFVFMGAFTGILKKEERKNLGFSAVPEQEGTSVSKEITRETLQEYGLMPEFLGRTQDFIVLDDFEEEDYVRIMEDVRYSPISKLESEYHIEVEMSQNKKREIAHTAFASGEGIRSMYTQLVSQAEDMLFEDCDARKLTFM